MASKLCVKFGKGTICIDVPLLIRDPHLPPGPDPWLTGEGISEQLSLQARAIATVAMASEYLPPLAKDAVHQALLPAITAVEKAIPGAKMTLQSRAGAGPGLDRPVGTA